MSRFPRAALDRSICDTFQEQVARDGDRLAVKGASGELTYRDLNRMANRLAHAILARQTDPKAPVAVFLEQGLEEVVGVLGILKAGHPYIALSASLAPDRLTRMLEDSTASLVVATTKGLDHLWTCVPETVPVITLDSLQDALPVEDPRLSLSADALACIIYTSGSTGEPKGVIHTHRTILHRVLEFTDGSALGPDDRVALLGSCAFSMTLRQVFGALLNGAALYAFDVTAKGADELAAWVTRERITLYASVPSVFRQFASALSGAEDLSALRMTRLTGEVVTAADVQLHRQRLPAHCALMIALSANETGTIAEWVVDRSERLTPPVVPCGYPPADTEVLLDDAGAKVSPGEIGEIVVRSRYLSPGYWGRPDLTQAAFQPDPDGGDARIYRTGDLGRFRPDGALEPCGRRDFWVKIRGQKVAVADVEAALVDLGVKQAVVVGRHDSEDGHRLVAYVIPRSTPAPTVSMLRRGLSERLPPHMVPSAFVVLDAMPLTAGGKVDRQALPSPPPTRPELDTLFVAPRTPVEEGLAEIWAEALRIDRVGVDDHFLDLGGHSLLAMRVVSRVIERFAVDVPVRALFEEPTVAAMAVVIVQHLVIRAGDDEMFRAWADLESRPPDASGGDPPALG